MWEPPYANWVYLMPLVGVLVWSGWQPYLSSGCAGRYHLGRNETRDGGVSWHWVWGRISSYLSVKCRIWPQVAGTEALRIGFKWALFSLSVYFFFSLPKPGSLPQKKRELKQVSFLPVWQLWLWSGSLGWARLFLTADHYPSPLLPPLTSQCCGVISQGVAGPTWTLSTWWGISFGGAVTVRA